MHHVVTEMCTRVHFCYKRVHCRIRLLVHCGICEMSLLFSCWQNFHYWLHRKLSKWQFQIFHLMLIKYAIQICSMIYYFIWSNARHILIQYSSVIYGFFFFCSDELNLLYQDWNHHVICERVFQGHLLSQCLDISCLWILSESFRLQIWRINTWLPCYLRWIHMLNLISYCVLILLDSCDCQSGLQNEDVLKKCYCNPLRPSDVYVCQ